MYIIFNEVRAYKQIIVSYAGVKPTRTHGVTDIVTLCIFLCFVVTIIKYRKEIIGNGRNVYGMFYAFYW